MIDFMQKGIFFSNKKMNTHSQHNQRKNRFKSHCQTFQQQFHLRQHPPQQQKTEDVRTARKQVSG